MSSEEQELQAKISKLRGQISQHRGSEPSNNINTRSGPAFATSNRGGAYPSTYLGRGRGRGGPVRGNVRGRGGAPIYRNRTLVLNGSASSDPTPDGSDGSGTSTPSGAWVTKTDRHMQLINSSVYERTVQQRATAIEDTRQQKLKQRDEREKAKLNRHLQHLASNKPDTGYSTKTSINHEIDVQGIRFRVVKEGSKLVKVSNDLNSAKSTPKSAIIAGVTFLRSKNGNLYRASVIKAQRRGASVRKIDAPCKVFSTTGSCSKGPRCRYTHDASKVAICKDFLSTGSCPNGTSCDLSHELTPERTPHCVHFAKGACTNELCRYTHIRVASSASVCDKFPVYGYCELGASCTQKHVYECPEFSNTGVCHTVDCKLPHRIKASILRKNVASSGEDSDISSDEDDQAIDSDDVDSDEFEEFFGNDDGVNDTDFADQKDFVQM